MVPLVRLSLATCRKEGFGRSCGLVFDWVRWGRFSLDTCHPHLIPPCPDKFTCSGHFYKQSKQLFTMKKKKTFNLEVEHFIHVLEIVETPDSVNA